MTNCRSLRQEVMSDNGTSFVGTNTGLKELISKFDKTEKSAASNGIIWHFNPPVGPHFSGVHENIIRVTKRAIYGILSHAPIIVINSLYICRKFNQVQTISNSRH